MILKFNPWSRAGMGTAARTLLCAIAIEVVSGLGTSGGFGISRGAHADVLFDNFGPNNSYSTTSGFPFGAFGAGTVEHAFAFTIAADYFLTGGNFGVGFIIPGPSFFDIAVHADSGNGLPGAVLEQVMVHQQVGSFSTVNPPIVMTFAGTTQLDAGEQYWISMSSDAATTFGWNQNNIGDAGPHAVMVDGEGWMLEDPNAFRGVFRLHGTLVSAPSGIGLLVLLVCVPRRARKRQRG